MPPTKVRAEEIRQALKMAETQADECDSVIIVMEKRTGGVNWHSSDSMTLATMNWLLDSMKFHIHTVLSGRHP